MKGPFNAADREKAELTRVFYENLREKMKGEVYRSRRESEASVVIGYEGLSRQYIGCVDILL